MALSLAEVKQALGAYTAAFDAALVPPGRLGEVLNDAGAIEAGQAFGELPELGAAARAGQLSRAQAVLVSGAAQANPGATAGLLEAARNGSLSELATEAARARAGTTDLDARRAAVRAARSLRERTDPFGTWQLHARGLPEDGARVMAALRPLADQAFAAARKDNRPEASEAYGFDALVALAGGKGTGAVGYEVMVRVDHAALLRGYALDGETCELAGFGPVSRGATPDGCCASASPAPAQAPHHAPIPRWCYALSFEGAAQAHGPPVP